MRTLNAAEGRRLKVDGMQLAMFDAPPMARASDPATSHAAAASARDLQGDHHAVILAALKKFGPAGKDRIASLCRLTGVAVARRTIELQRAGLIEPTGRTVRSTSRRQEREWRFVRIVGG